MIIVVLILLGLVLGSFINAFVWRLHEQAELAGKNGATALKRRAALSITRGRSMCPHCGHELAARDLVPVASWLALRGRCRYCQAPISWQYPLVELLTAVLFVVSYFSWPFDLSGAGLFQFVLWLVFVVGFVALAVYDLRWFILPNKVVLPLAALAVVQVVVVALWRHDAVHLWKPALGVLIIAGLFWVLFQVSRGGWIGGGDVKLGIVLGLLAGSPLRAFLVIFLASLIGTVASLPLLAKSGKGLKLHIPFGPYLLLGMVIVQLYGTQLIHWYQNLLLV